jgi:lipid II:glycine glycyltransferase (peptidoglycan interpeptide bridge formation enzyme)
MTCCAADLLLAEPIVVRRETEPDRRTIARWDKLVERSPGTDVTQLSAWATIRAEAGFSPLYLLAHQGDTLVGGCLVLRRRLLAAVSICYVPYGPLVDESHIGAKLAANSLVTELTSVARSSAMTFVQPPEGADYVTKSLLARGFRPSNAGIAPSGSYRLDLTRSLVEIRRDFSPRLKSWTNRWPAKGVFVRKGDFRDLPLLADLMAKTALRQGFSPPSFEHLSLLYRTLAPNGNAALFVGEVNGQPVAVDLVTMLGDTVQGKRCGFDSSGPSGRLSVPAAVRWEIIKWAKSEGYRWLDFGGLPQQMLDDMLDRGIDNNAEWPSAHRAKLSFHGTPFRYPAAVELVRPLPMQWAYDLGRRNVYGRRLVAGVKASLRSCSPMVGR